MAFFIILGALILLDAHLDMRITSLSRQIDIVLSRIHSIYEYGAIEEEEKKAIIHNLMKENDKLRKQVESPEYKEFLKGYNCGGYHD